MEKSTLFKISLMGMWHVDPYNVNWKYKNIKQDDD